MRTLVLIDFSWLYNKYYFVASYSLGNDIKGNFKATLEDGLYRMLYEFLIRIVSTNKVKLYFVERRLLRKIDDLAKKNNCTITGSGYQDIYWGQLVTAIAASTHKITKIIGESWYNVEDYGIALAEAHGAGLTLAEFDEKIASVDRMSDEERQALIDGGTYAPSYMWNVNGWLCEKLGLHAISQSQKCVPETYHEDINSTTLGMVVKAGDATGMSAVVTTETEEGITLETKCVGKVYAPDEFDINEWTVEGEPNTTITVQRPATVELTCASIVNRIPDLIKARPGFVPTSQMPEPTYRVKSLEEYLN